MPSTANSCTCVVAMCAVMQLGTEIVFLLSYSGLVQYVLGGTNDEWFYIVQQHLLLNSGANI